MPGCAGSMAACARGSRRKHGPCVRRAASCMAARSLPGSLRASRRSEVDTRATGPCTSSSRSLMGTRSGFLVSGAVGSPGQGARWRGSATDKLQAKRTELWRSCPRTIGSFGEAHVGVAVPPTSSKRNARNCDGAAPELLEALGEARAGMAVPPRSLERNT